MDDWREWSTSDKLRLFDELRERNRRARSLTPERYLEEGLDLEGITLAPYQVDIIRSVFEKSRTCIGSPRGAGKTASVALAMWGFILKHHLLKHDWKVATTAGAWRQLTRFLWPEVHKWHRRINWEKLGVKREDIELLTNEIKAPTGQAFAMASNNPFLLEGVHADHLLIIVDEAKAVPKEMFDALEGAMGSGSCSALVISTPGIPAGRFYEIHSKAVGLEDWAVANINLDDAIKAGRVDAEWAEQRRRQYGENSAIYKNYVLGEFASSEDGGLIPLDWIEQAMERSPHKRPLPTTIGLDVAYEGADKSVAAVATTEGVTELIEWQGLRETELVGEVLFSAKRVVDGFPVQTVRDFTVDAIGIGAGVCERLEQAGMTVTRFIGSNKPTESLGYIEFSNRRAEAYWKLRNMLDPENPNAIFLPPHDGLKGDLVAIRWHPDPHGRVLMVKKDAIKRALGRSPDYGDAVAYAMWGANEETVGWDDV